MKIGIMTYWSGNNNYGSILQCWALQRFLKKHGHAPYLIRYHYRVGRNLSLFLRKILNPRKAWDILKRRCTAFLFADKSFEHRQREVFLDFLHHDIDLSEQEYGSVFELKAQPPVAEAYIAGSDQIWNFYNNKLSVVKDHIHAFFLCFGNENIRRISYAASFGGDTFKAEYANEIEPLLARFNAVSVREKIGVDICRSYGREDAVHVLDPTLLLSAEDYRAFYQSKQIKMPERKFVFVYLLENKSSASLDEIAAWAKQQDLEVIYIPGQGSHKNTSVSKSALTVQEWLCWLDNAECVITNSFHCCVFSLIFRKQFAFVRQIGKFVSQNKRIDNLLSMFEVGNRDYCSIGDPRNIAIDYDNVAKLHAQYLEDSQKFLNRSLKDCK